MFTIGSVRLSEIRVVSPCGRAQGADFSLPVKFQRYASEFKEVGVLGKGGFGSVFKVVAPDGAEYAVKKVNFRLNTMLSVPAAPEGLLVDPNVERQFREPSVMSVICTHKNIVGYFQAWIEPNDGDKTLERNNDCDSTGNLTGWETAKEDTSDKIMSFIMNEAQALAIHSAEGAKPPSTLPQPFYSAWDEESHSVDYYSSVSGSRNQLHQNDSKVPQIPLGHIKTMDQDSNDNDEPSSFNSAISKSEASQYFLNFTLYIQMQLCGEMTLKDWMEKNLKRGMECLSIFKQILQGLHHIHSNGFIHRDLKPSNLFIKWQSDEMNLKIGDFGLSVSESTTITPSTNPPLPQPPLDSNSHSGSHTSGVGTTFYASPEQQNGQLYDYKTDIFSLGVILFELYHPFTTTLSRIKTLQEVYQNATIPNWMVQQFPQQVEWIRAMIHWVPSNRPSTEEVIQSSPLLAVD